MKTITPRALVVAFFGAAWLLVAAPAAAAAESLSLLLQKAIYAEETEGNLDSAIKLYEQIAAESAANRSVAAQAQYRLAVCYQKLGRKELAISTLVEIQRQFPADRSLGQKVHDMLAALGQAPAEVVKLRKVTLVNTSWIRDVSPDGRWAAYTGDNGEVYVRETATGATRVFVDCNWDNYPWALFFAPDSARVVYDTFGTTLRIANIDGSGMRELYQAKAGETIAAAGWIAKTGQIVAVLEEGMPKIKTLVSFDPRSGELKRFNIPPVTGRFGIPSEDGRFIAMFESTGNRNSNRVSVVSLESGRTEVVLENDDAWPLGWAHDDSVFLFRSRRSGGQSLYSVPIAAGKAAGAPILLKEYASDVYLVNAKPDGRIYFAEDNKTANIHVVPVDFETGQTTREPQLATERFPGVQISPEWSRDGSRLWFAVNGEQRRFVSVSTRTGKEEDFPFTADFRSVQGKYSISADGSYVLLEGRREQKQGNAVNGLYKYDFESRKVESLATSRRGDWYRQPRILPDGKSFVYLRQQSSGEGESRISKHSIVRRDFATGEDKVLYEMTGERNLAWPYEPAFSPDGSLLAFAVTDHIYKVDYTITVEVLNLRDGQLREMVRLQPRENLNSLEWTPDGRRLVYSKIAPTKDGVERGPSEVWSLTLDSGRQVKLALSMQNISEIAVHPDGRQLAIRTGGNGDSAQLWVMDGLQREPIARASASPRPKTIARSGSTLLRPEDLVGPNQVVRDAEIGVTAVLPAGWTLKRGSRSLSDNHPNVWPEGLTSLELDSPGSSVVARLNYHIYEAPRPMNGAELEKWLRDFSSQVVASRSVGMPDFKIDPGSFVFRTIGGNAALSWTADFTWVRRDNVKGKEYGTIIRGDKGHALVWAAVHATEFATVRREMEGMVESVRLP